MSINDEIEKILWAAADDLVFPKLMSGEVGMARLDIKFEKQ